MTIKEAIQAKKAAVKALFQPSHKASSRRNLFKKELSARKKKEVIACRDGTITEATGDESSCTASFREDAFFRDELAYVKQHPHISSITLRNFVARYERDDMSALAEILRTNSRKFSQIKFEDTTDGASYRRWQFRKDNLIRLLEQAQASRTDRQALPVTFEGRLDINIGEMSCHAIESLLHEVTKDRSIKFITFAGTIHQDDLEAIARILMQDVLPKYCHWRGIVLRISFGCRSNEYPEWSRKVKCCKKRLEDFSGKYCIPIGVHILS